MKACFANQGCKLFYNEMYEKSRSIKKEISKKEEAWQVNNVHKIAKKSMEYIEQKFLYYDACDNIINQGSYSFSKKNFSELIFSPRIYIFCQDQLMIFL